MKSISQRVDELLASHYYCEVTGTFKRYGDTTGNVISMKEALEHEERIYANLVKRREETRQRNAEVYSDDLENLIDMMRESCNVSLERAYGIDENSRAGEWYKHRCEGKLEW